MNQTYPFPLVTLGYPYDALEPYIDKETMELHHNKHLKTYVENLNNALKPYPFLHSMTLTSLLNNLASLPPEIQEKVRNNGGGVFNHNLFFAILSSKKSVPSPALEEQINKNFGSFERLQKQLKEISLSVFGSGYAALAINKFGDLIIIPVRNQDTLLPLNLQTILVLDVWEHAYYLKYKNKRFEYLDQILNLINWDIVSNHFSSIRYFSSY